MLREFTEIMLAGKSLTTEQAFTALDSILQGNYGEVSIAGFLTAMAAKGEVADEIAGMARALRQHAVPVHTTNIQAIDVVGTGGDSRNTFNISTATALVTAGAGIAVAKHGNRAITSQCGSADVLDQLGVNLNASPQVIAQCIEQANMGFMFAPHHHPTMKYVQPVRKQLGFRTIFNILGPLANPASVQYAMIGVAKPYLLDIIAPALKQLGIKRAFIVYGAGSDEVSTCGPTDITELNNNQLTHHTIDYSDYGISRADWDDITGGTAQENANIIRSLLDGSLTGPKRDVVVLNAAVAIMLTGKATGIMEGIKLARQSIDNHHAANVLTKMIEITNNNQ